MAIMRPRGPSAGEIAAHLNAKPLSGGRGWMACCPAHDDKRPSLHIREGDTGQALVHCYSGCSRMDVIQVLRDRGVWPERRAPRTVAASIWTYQQVQHAAMVVRIAAFQWENQAIRARWTTDDWADIRQAEQVLQESRFAPWERPWAGHALASGTTPNLEKAAPDLGSSPLPPKEVPTEDQDDDHGLRF